jgi:hypothetical protein
MAMLRSAVGDVSTSLAGQYAMASRKHFGLILIARASVLSCGKRENAKAVNLGIFLVLVICPYT